MSEYWVSHKKYFCKYCNIYIADDVPSRRQHEGGLRHKGNVERFVRNLYKTGEKRKQDLEEEKREMARVERAAQAAFAQDVGAGLVKPGSSSQVPVSKEAGPSQPARKTDPYSDYSTAASLGFTDPDEARIQAEIERRSKEGVAGAWEVVEVAEPPLAQAEEEHKTELPGALEDSSRKREAEAPLDEEDARAFKLRKKKLGAGLGEIYDPGIIPIKLKKKEEPAPETVPSTSNLASGSSSMALENKAATFVPKWTSRGWSKPGEAEATQDVAVEQDNNAEKDEVATEKEAGDNSSTLQDASPEKIQKPELDVKVNDEAVPKAENVEPPQPSSSTGSLFKKRKVPAGGAGRVRRV